MNSMGFQVAETLLAQSTQDGLPPLRLHSARNFFRSLPCRFFASACSEQALEIAAFSARVGFTAGVVAAGFVAAAPGVLVAGGVCARPAAPMMAMAAAVAKIGNSFMRICFRSHFLDFRVHRRIGARTCQTPERGRKLLFIPARLSALYDPPNHVHAAGPMRTEPIRLRQS